LSQLSDLLPKKLFITANPDSVAVAYVNGANLKRAHAQIESGDSIGKTCTRASDRDSSGKQLQSRGAGLFPTGKDLS
jgi:hypothetical protein